MNLLSAAYAAVAAARRRSYQRHPSRKQRLARPVVSIGNLSVGGTGKTPTVASVARLLLAAGERPAILTRGYARRDAAAAVVVVSDGIRMRADLARSGDEPLMLARALPGVAVLVGADRHASGIIAERDFGSTVHLLDDGFQHVRLARDVDVVMVRAEDLKDRVLPAGRLRERVDALSAADAVVLVAQRRGAVEDDIADEAGQAVAAGEEKTTGMDVAPPASARRFRATERMVIGDLAGARGATFAVAGIARPRRFFDGLAAAGVRVSGEMNFRDHHHFTARDLERIVRAARQAGAARIATTEKDYVRFLPMRPFPMPVVPVGLEVVIEPAEEFRSWLLSRIAAARQPAATGRAELL